MLVGLDFDNTIVCYSKAIEVLSASYLDLPKELGKEKTVIKNYLAEAKRGEEWTQFQGLLYSKGLEYAEPYNDVVDVMQELTDIGCNLCIISHKTKEPFAGPSYDLHTAAAKWIDKHLRCRGLVNGDGDVVFRPTKESKIKEIESRGCDVFLDDLYEILHHCDFPRETRGVLFNPGSNQSVKNALSCVGDWAEFRDLVIDMMADMWK